jgi:TRAP-type C4-dicarboxylate transport system substrate-binding protein
MKRTAFSLLPLAFSLFCLCASTQAFAAQPATRDADKIIHVSMISGFDEGHPVSTQVWQPWIAELKAKTNGRLVITLLPPDGIGPARGYFEATQRGLAGIGHQAVSLTRWQLPATSVLDIPSSMANSLAASDAFWTLYETSPEMQAEFKEIKLLALHSFAPSQFNMARGNITMLDDFRDKRMLAASAEQARILRALGAKPRIMHYTGYKDLLDRGLANGCLLPLGALRDYGADKSVTNLTLANIYLGASWLGMNRDVYESLPPDCRAAVDESSGRKLSMALGEALLEFNRQNLKALTANGVAINKITIAERVRWLNLIIPPTRDEWFKLAERRKLKNAEELYRRSRAIFEEAASKYAHLN